MKRLLAMLLALFAAAPILAAQTTSGEARPWEYQSSDIPVDARIHFGHFENGLRYAWANNPKPEDRVYLRLHVNVGSLAEQDDQRGMAHFLEHMAFNGSEHFPPGTLIEWFQSHGMSFGADTNAHTAFSETVYKLDLPNHDPQTLREGLQVMRDFATGMSIQDEEVQSEKGVIDGEQRERDSAGFRMMVKQIDIVLGGTRYALRLPIGLKKVRDRFTGQSVAAFYRKWYRPEHMTLIMVGDLGDYDPTPLFEEFFAGIPAPPSKPPLEPAPGKPSGLHHDFVLYESEIPTANITLERLWPHEMEHDTVEKRVEKLPLVYAHSMLNLRFSELAKKADAPFLSARTSEGGAFDVLDGEDLSISCNPEQWEKALDTCEQELRRALKYGFQQSELDEVRADALRSLDEAVEREKTADSHAILNALLAAAEDRVVPTDAVTRRKILKPAIEALSVEDCHEALVRAWSRGELSVYATGGLDLGGDGDQELRAAYEASHAVEVQPAEKKETSQFAYASDPSRHGKIAERKHVDDLDFEMIRFENGVTINLKPTDFKKKQILISASLGEGQLSLGAQGAPLFYFAGDVLNQGGLGKHSEDDLRRLTAGKTVGVNLGTGEDRFSLSGSTTREDLLMECELMCAYLQDPGWREDGLVQSKRQLPLLFQALPHQVQGPLIQDFIPAVYSNDPRFGIPPQEDLEAVTVKELEEWMDPFLEDAPLEITIVGDFDLEDTVAACSRTFGMLPKRRPLRDYAENRVVPTPKSGIDQTHEIVTQVPKSLVFILYPTDDGMVAPRRRTLAFLGRVLNDRLRLEVREKLGAAYSPGAISQTSEVYPHDGLLGIQAMSDPDKVQTLVDACLNTADTLASKGIDQEELDRLREPLLNQLRDAMRTNGYWLQVLSDAHRRPASLDEARTTQSFYESLTPQRVSEYAAKYLHRDRASVLVVNPAGEVEGEE